MSITLYQWPGTDKVESIFPRCVLFQRILNLSEVKYTVKNVNLSEDLNNFEESLNSYILNIPQLKYKDKIYRNSTEIIKVLLDDIASTSAVNSLENLQHPTDYIVEEWAREIFVDSLVYARWVDEKSFIKFSSSIKWEEKPSPEMLKLLRNKVLIYLKKKGIGHFDKITFLDHLQKQLWALEKILVGRDYFSENNLKPSMMDLSIFITTQGLFNIELEEYQDLKSKVPELYKWNQKIDNYTYNSLAQKKT